MSTDTNRQRVTLMVPLTAGLGVVEAGMPLRSLLAAKAATTGRTVTGPLLYSALPEQPGDKVSWWVASVGAE